MKKTLLALLATSLVSGAALASDASFSVTWTGAIPVAEKDPTGWKLKDGDTEIGSLTKALTVERAKDGDSKDILELTSTAFNITAAANDDTATLGAITAYLADSSIEGLTPAAGADPVSLTFKIGTQEITESEKGNSYVKDIMTSSSDVESIQIGFKGTVDADEWDKDNDTNVAVTASFVIATAI